MLLGQAAAQEGFQRLRQQHTQALTQALNKVQDPYHDNDPIRDPAFREEYMHPDGSINE